MTSKAKRAQYTLEFKLEAVRLVKAGQSMAAVAATLGVVELDNEMTQNIAPASPKPTMDCRSFVGPRNPKGR